MALHIYPKDIGGHTYYYAHRTWREKVDPRACGKTRGSGKSRMRSQTIYLGAAEQIVEALHKTRQPVEVRHRAFGMVGAAYQTAIDLGLVDVLREHIEGERFGVPRWLFFLLPILNRLQHATSKARMGEWAAGTVLPSLLGFDAKRLTSQRFWYVTDDLINEKELRERREKDPDLDDTLFAGLDDKAFRAMEDEVAALVLERFPLTPDILLYDTTNFFTYIEEPVRSKLARTGHNKDCHHHLRQVGLALCVDKQWGLPLFYRLYRGNSHDARTFGQIVEDLLASLRAGFAQIDTLALVLDKGNNSTKNFAALNGVIRWVGSLTPSHHEDLMALPLDAYTGQWENGQGTVLRYHCCRRNVMGIDCALVLTYNDRLQRKQDHSFEKGIDKIERQMNEKWASYKRRPATVPPAVADILKESAYAACITAHVKNGQLVFTPTQEIQTRKKRFGKNLLFSAQPEDDPAWIIAQYHSKDRIEDDFKLLKDPELIRWRPCRHWTDTKIRAFGFCCVMALLLIRVMHRKAAHAGILMSPALIKQELDDLREITVVYDAHTADVKISVRSSVQQRLYDLFNLSAAENQLTRHHSHSHPKQ